MQHSDLFESSMNFDMADVGPFLHRVGSLVEGLSDAQVDALLSEIADLPVEAEREWSFSVRYGGAEVPLRIRAFMDDVDAPDLAFFTGSELARAIDMEMTAYAEERGL